MSQIIEMPHDLVRNLSAEATIVSVPTHDISDWASFHKAFKAKLGFPDSYGNTLEDWVDCLTYVDAQRKAMTTVTVEDGQHLILKVEDSSDFSKRCPEQFQALIDCAAFVNCRRAALGKSPVTALLLT
jgi:Barstar (barnase inhibitor)